MLGVGTDLVNLTNKIKAAILEKIECYSIIIMNSSLSLKECSLDLILVIFNQMHGSNYNFILF